MLNPTRARVIAAIAVISAIASPAGSARPLSDPPLPTSSHTLAASGRSAPSPQVVRPNPDQQVQPASASGVPPILRRARPSELAVIDRAEAREEGPLSPGSRRPLATAPRSSMPTTGTRTRLRSPRRRSRHLAAAFTGATRQSAPAEASPSRSSREPLPPQACGDGRQPGPALRPRSAEAGVTIAETQTYLATTSPRLQRPRGGPRPLPGPAALLPHTPPCDHRTSSFMQADR
jgi:hypothetical protein